MEAQVTWILMNYTSKRKVFRARFNEIPDTFLLKAQQFAEQLQKEEERSETGIYRSIEVDVFAVSK